MRSYPEMNYRLIASKFIDKGASMVIDKDKVKEKQRKRTVKMLRTEV